MKDQKKIKDLKDQEVNTEKVKGGYEENPFKEFDRKTKPAEFNKPKTGNEFRRADQSFQKGDSKSSL